MSRLAKVAATVKHGGITIEVHEYADGRFGFDVEETGQGRLRIRRKELADAEKEARDRARLLHNGRVDLLSVSTDELAEFRRWKAGRASVRAAGAILTEFIELKREDAHINRHYIANLERWLRDFTIAFGDLGAVRAGQIETYLRDLGKEPRSRNNIRDAITALFRFARERAYLPDSTTEAERVKRLKLRRASGVSCYDPGTMEALLSTVREQFLPWAAIGGFAGVRTEEIQPPATKDPLRWEDFRWGESTIFLRPETDKNGRGRAIPILPALEAWLANHRQRKGPVLAGAAQVRQESARLRHSGVAYIKNGLRHSFGSYRLAVVKSIAQVAEEMGNSPTVIRRDYQTPQSDGAAEKWFGIRPT